MRKYELMVILDPTIEERSIGTSMEKILRQVTTEGGTVDNIDVWGKRHLAYEIQKHSEGYYVVADLTCSSDMAKEIDRQLGLNESVLRTKLLRRDQK
ncbi:30S ribosomal protein S6 [Actinomycetaceae bacterium MB13-C1-2]|nr:30S ribosomal protein S6 [Actinomycetaceae bacterium MB13-C1-2]